MPWTAADLPDLSGRTAVVTGASSGLGLVIARELAAHGAAVIMACRDAAKGAGVAATMSGDRRVVELDLASQESIRRFADTVPDPVDILVNNAGVMSPPSHRATQDGFELQFGTNHLGHFALTALLMPQLRAAPTARIVTVSSIAHQQADRSVLEGNPAQGYSPVRSYANSKLANLLFADELHARSVQASSSVTSSAAHPGVSSTNLFRNPEGIGRWGIVRLGGQLVSRFMAPPERGAEAILYAATVAEAGSYSGPTGWREIQGPVGSARRSQVALDTQLRVDLWERSVELTGVEPLFA